MITKQMAQQLRSGRVLYYNRTLGSDKRPVRARVNGKCQTWKRDPDKFRLPMVHGLRDYFQLTNENAAHWCHDEADALREYNTTERQSKMQRCNS